MPPVRHSFSLKVIAVRLATTLAGGVLFVYGLIAAFSPLPAGAPLVIIGLLMIAAVNPAARPFIRSMRRRWPWFDRLVRFVARSGPHQVRAVARDTAPEEQNNERQGDLVP